MISVYLIDSTQVNLKSEVPKLSGNVSNSSLDIIQEKTFSETRRIHFGAKKHKNILFERLILHLLRKGASDFIDTMTTLSD